MKHTAAPERLLLWRVLLFGAVPTKMTVAQHLLHLAAMPTATVKTELSSLTLRFLPLVVAVVPAASMLTWTAASTTGGLRTPIPHHWWQQNKEDIGSSKADKTGGTTEPMLPTECCHCVCYLCLPLSALPGIAPHRLASTSPWAVHAPHLF